MRVFQIRQNGTSAILWTGEATGKPEALDAMAHAAGYQGAGDLPTAIRGSGLSVEELRFGVTPPPAPRNEGGRTGRIFRTGFNGRRDERAVG